MLDRFVTGAAFVRKNSTRLAARHSGESSYAANTKPDCLAPRYCAGWRDGARSLAVYNTLNRFAHQMLKYGPPEHVFVETEWYDGPRAGIANVNGQPHRFVSQWDEHGDQYLGTFLVWPVRSEELSLEQEQWRIFVSWNDKYEAGAGSAKTHPGNPGTNSRWDELSVQLATLRAPTPAHALKARAEMVPLDRERRYDESGPSYQMSWSLL
jgi:hypothetical protein